MKVVVLFLWMLLFGFCLNAQTMSDTLQEFLLKEKKKTSNNERINTYSSGQKIQTIDSSVLLQYQQQNLAQLLTQQMPVFIKSYGFNGLATVNIRGASAAQSQVLWNGIPITNAALGMADVSSMPVFFIQNLQLVYGSSAALFGSGNVGGTISIETTQPKFQTQNLVSVFLGGGSFGQMNVGGKLEVSNKKWFCSSGFFLQSAQNNFPFKDISGNQQTTIHAQMNGWSSVSSVAFKPNDKNIVQLSLWLQQYNREIPAALFESFSAKERKDNSLRFLLDWQHSSSRWKWFAKTSFIQDDMKYLDSTVQLNTVQHSFQSYSEVGWQYKKKHHSLLVFTPVQISWMLVSQSTKYLSQLAVAAVYQLDYHKWQFTKNSRLSLVNEKKVWLTGLNIYFKAADHFQLRLNAQKTYRTPSLNELYFSPGGNDQLKPEHGWNEEVGYKWSISFNENTKLIQDVSIFHRHINNWILWMGGAIWTPHNIASVSSNGLEIDHSFFLKRKTITWNFGLNTSFVKAITTQSDIPNDGSIGKQIPYTPFVNAVLHAGIQQRNWSVHLNQTYTGIRYINSDETGRIDDYFTTNLQGNFTTNFFHKDCNFYFQINNLLNEHYEVVSTRPMPGINFLGGLIVNWN